MKETESLDWNEFIEAVNIFKDDYAIVGHGGEPRAGFFGELRPHLEYSVTGKEVDDMSEEEFAAKLNEKPVVVLIECMDRRGAYLGRGKVQSEILQENGIDPEGVNLLTVAVGGGIIQRNIIITKGEEKTVDRARAMKRILQYIADNAEVRLVVATGHNHRCGAEAFAADGQGWPERLGVEPGDAVEDQKMRELISAQTRVQVPQVWQEAGIVRSYLVKFSHDPETDQRVELEKV